MGMLEVLLAAGVILFIFIVPSYFAFRRPKNFSNWTLGHQLVWRATGLCGDFRLPLVIYMIAYENLQLDNIDRDIILRRFKKHCQFWDIRVEYIKGELRAFSGVTHRPYQEIAEQFDLLDVKKCV